ncbi:MAG: hybrid sensor histidine kinase/response regulator, partial [Thiobacillus sp.]|nr:hybrid sensor histidine kinase/response regulator [Thiobacillus sp.]
MNSLRTLSRRLSLSSIRSRMLVIALLPALLAEFGMAAYFTTQTLATAENALHARAADAVRHLADTLPYALINGDLARVDRLLKTEAANSQLAFARVSDARGQMIAGTGDSLHAALPHAHYTQHNEIRLPAADFNDDPL